MLACELLPTIANIRRVRRTFVQHKLMPAELLEAAKIPKNPLN